MGSVVSKMSLEIDGKSVKEAEGLLNQLDVMVRGPLVSRALRAHGMDAKREIRQVIPKPGYPGDKPEYAPLRDQVKVRVKSYENGAIKVVVVGYGWPEGAHGQPLEAGHEKWLWGEQKEGEQVEPFPYSKEVIERLNATPSRALIDSVRRSLSKLKGA